MTRRSARWLASYAALALCVIMGGVGGTLAQDHRWLELALVLAFTGALAWIAAPPPARSGPPPESAPPPPDH
jgi:hypothetical protein